MQHINIRVEAKGMMNVLKYDIISERERWIEGKDRFHIEYGGASEGTHIHAKALVWI